NHAPKKNCVHPCPIENIRSYDSPEKHSNNLNNRRDSSGHPDSGKASEAEFEAKSEHQKDDPKFCPNFNALGIRDRKDGGSVRSNDNSCDDVTKNNRLLYTPEDESYNRSHT